MNRDESSMCEPTAPDLYMRVVYCYVSTGHVLLALPIKARAT